MLLSMLRVRLGDLLFSDCDVPITVYFVLLTLSVSLLFLNQLLMCFNSDVTIVWISCTLLLEKKSAVSSAYKVC